MAAHLERTAPTMASGHGKTYTNKENAKHPRPLVPVTFSEIQSTVDNPPSRPKDKAQWVIPSTLMMRDHAAQAERGEFWMLWADLDKDPQPIDVVQTRLVALLGGAAQYEIYLSRSATEGNQRAHILIPLDKPLCGVDWVAAQVVLNTKLTEAGLVPDISNQGAGGLYYLPNRGEHYASLSQRTCAFFDPMVHWAAELEKNQRDAADAAARALAEKEAARARRAARTDCGPSLIDAFNADYTFSDILIPKDYDQKGDTFRHPKSESGSYSASVKDGRICSLSTADPLHKTERVPGTDAEKLRAHDVFSSFVVLHHDGDQDAALKDAGDNWVQIKGVPWNVVHARDKMDSLAGFADAVTASIASSTPRYKLLTSREIAQLPPLVWRVRGVLPDKGLAAIYGPSGSGKSFLAFDMAAAIAGGVHWFGCRVHRAPVVYVVLEGAGGLQQRVRAWETDRCRALPDEMGQVVQPFSLTNIIDLADMAAVVPHGAVVFIDTLNRAAPTADENSSRDMGEILEAAKRLQTHTGGLVVLVHHTGKDTTRGLRGHSSLFAALDAAVEVSRDGVQRAWSVAKSKDGTDGAARGFSLEVVGLGDDLEGEPLTSCVVRPVEEPLCGRKALSPSLETAMAAYQAAAIFGDGVSLEAWRWESYRATPGKSPDAQKKAFQRARTELVGLGYLVERDGIFSTPDLV